MAEEQDQDQEQENESSVADVLEDAEDDKSGKGSSKIIRILLPVGVVVIMAVAGHLASGLGASAPAQATAGEQEPQAAPPSGDWPSPGETYTYYDLETIIVNLSEPRLTRYLRATLTLATRPDDYKAAVDTIKKRMPELRNWLILYLSDCSVEEVRGAKNLNRIQRELQDSLNQRLWPGARPLIVKVGFKEWNVQ